MSTLRESVEWQVDVTGLHCPAPVIRCRAALARMAEGDVLTLRATDRDARREIVGLVGKCGHQMIAVRERAGAVEFTIRKRAPVRGRRVPDGGQTRPAFNPFSVPPLAVSYRC